MQLRDLSEISETLTLRLLELEERLAGLEGTLEALCRGQQAEAEGSDAIVDLLEQTENRISRLEGLLESGIPSGSTPRDATHLQLLPLAAPEDHPFAADTTEDPFPEEGEQPFMDELTA
jgi:hypothetical protein